MPGQIPETRSIRLPVRMDNGKAIQGRCRKRNIRNGEIIMPDYSELPDYSKLPERLQGGVQRYIEDGIQPGDFLTAVIQNNLTETVGKADDDMIKIIPQIVGWFYNEAPAICWGSKNKMKNWILTKDTQYKLRMEKI